METNNINNHFTVLIPDGESTLALLVLRCFSHNQHIKLCILSSDRWAPIGFSRYGSQFVSHTLGDEERLTSIIDTVRKTHVDIVLPVDEPTIRLLSAHRELLSPITALAPVPETTAFDIAADKWQFAEFLARHNIPTPPTILCRLGNQQHGFAQHLSSIPFPVLIKPTHGTGGEGIQRFESPSTLLKFCNDNAGSEESIVQSFIRGYDIGCSVLCRDGQILAYTMQRAYIEGDRRFSPPAGIEFLYDDTVYDLVSRLVDALKWTGVANIDMRYDEQDGRPKVLEMNPRFWGSLMGSLSAGINFPYLACLAGLRVDLPTLAYQPKRYIRDKKVAIQTLTHGILQGTRSAARIASTSIESMLRDPLPHIVGHCRDFYTRILRRMERKA